MNKQICIIGMGYVGISTAACFAELGNTVYCLESDKIRLQNFKEGKVHIYEPGIEDLVKKNIDNGRLIPTLSYSEGILNSDLIFICVGTPTNSDGSMNLDYIKDVSREIGKIIKNTNKFHSIIIKSTILPGTTKEFIIPILEEHSGKKVGKEFGIGVNPEFLREGSAIEDFMSPDITVIGQYDDITTNSLIDVYKKIDPAPFITGLAEAEMIKFYYNVSRALKISFLNEIANICKEKKINVSDVIKAGMHDKKIVHYYVMPGCGFGGSCLPKDIRSLINFAKSIGYEPRLLEETLELNERQKIRIVHQLKEKLGDLRNKKIAILGFSFKENTNDIRESPSITCISELRKLNANVVVYDPKSRDKVKEIFSDVNIANSISEALNDSDGCLIVTDWSEFKNLKESDFELMKNKIIIEGKAVLTKENFKTIEFEGINW